MKKIRFYLNKEFDKVMLEQFLDVSGGGIDFGKGIVKMYPKLQSAKNESDISKKRKLVSSFCNTFYGKNKKQIVVLTKKIEKEWKKVEEEYFKITKKYFEDFDFPKGKYIAYASIVNCNPRFLDSKTFQFYYKKDIADAVHTIAHEIMHFIFFDFVEKNMSKEISVLTEDDLWDLSEIFNYVVLKSNLYKSVVDKKVIRYYPDHREIIKNIDSKFVTNVGIKDFIIHCIKKIKVAKG